MNEIFSKGYYFSGLNYQNFHKVLYDFDNFKIKNKKTFLAKVIIAMPTEKLPLYERFKIKENTAYYDFGPIYVKDQDNREIETRITVDELIAAAWNKQICFGLNVEGIKQKINSNFIGMGEIAKSTTPVKGEDAKLVYLTKVEKDMSPVENRKTGRLDLKRNKCTFPQILDLKQNRIICKVNATEGVPGYYLNGKPIPPKPGRDLDLKVFMGEGTNLILEKELEYLIANRIGYIIVNPKNNKISVTAEAQNYSPIGPETGNLEIKASNFVQHNDILNGYSVRCNNINIEDGSVNGEIISERGRIEIQGNVNSGRLIAQDGIIRVKGIVTMNSYLESLKGDIILDTVENSTLIGKNISVAHAVNCNITGENITITNIQSSRVAGLSVCIGNSEASSKKGENTDIIIPILEFTDKRIRVIDHILQEKKGKKNEIDDKINKLKQNKMLQDYLKAVKASDAPAMNAMLRNATPIMNEINKSSKESASYKEEIANIEANLQSLREKHEQKLNTLQKMQRCVIENSLNENINLKLYGGLDWPLEFELVGAEEESSYKNFMALVDSLTQGFSNYKRKGCVQLLTEPCIYDHFALLKMYASADIIDPARKNEGSLLKTDPGKAEQRESRVSVITEEDFKHFLKEKKWLPGKRSLDVTIDGIFKGYIHDFSTSELAMFLEKAQKWRPIFEKGEKLKLIATVFGDELKYDFIIAYINEKPDFLRISGYFININNEDVDKLYKLKNRFEVLQKSSGSVG